MIARKFELLSCWQPATDTRHNLLHDKLCSHMRAIDVQSLTQCTMALAASPPVDLAGF